MNVKVIGFRSRWSQVKVCEATITTDLSSTQLLVNVSLVAINPIDVKVKRMAFLPYNRKAGKEFSGVVEKIGNSVTSHWKIGDRICGILNSPFVGSLGTKAIVDIKKDTIMHSPDNLSDEQAAAFPVSFGTALDMLGRTARNGKVLVLGGGSSVGSYVIQLAKQKYMFTEVVATCSQRSAEFVSLIGADTIVDYEANGSLSEQFKSLHIKFDAILDTVGGYDALRVWPDILKSYDEGGVYISLAGDRSVTSYQHGPIRPILPALPWMVPRLLIGKQLGINYQFLLKKSDCWTTEAASFFATKDFQIRIAQVFGLHECMKAWEYVENIKGSGKVLVNMH